MEEKVVNLTNLEAINYDEFFFSNRFDLPINKEEGKRTAKQDKL